MPINTFHKLYNDKPILNDASFTFLSITDDLQYEIKYKNGEVFSFSIINEKNKRPSSGKEDNAHKTQIECFDVWWVTTYPNGSTTWEYLYSFCNGGEQECKGATINNSGRTFRIGCGVGGGNPVIATKPVSWVVAESANLAWHVKSYEVLSGQKTGNEPSIFNGINHTTSSLFNTQGGPGNATWSELSAVAGLMDSYSAKSEVFGKTTINVSPPYDIPVHSVKTWYSPTEFP